MLEGDAILKEGQEVARHLWNFTRYCAVSYNRKVQRWREGKIYKYDKEKDKWYPRHQSLTGKLPKYARFAEVLRQITYKAEEVLQSRDCNSRNGLHIEYALPVLSVPTASDGRQERIASTPSRSRAILDGKHYSTDRVMCQPSSPSPPARTARTGKAGLPASQIDPTFVAKFDLRNWSIKQACCTASPTGLVHEQSAQVGT